MRFYPPACPQAILQDSNPARRFGGATKDHMVDGCYIVFDDALYSACLGSTEVVEDLLTRRDGLSCEQIYSHFVFRRWR